MNVGITLPSDEQPGAFARFAEETGIESVWTGDHLISVTPRLDSMLVLTHAAATTTTLRLGFGVLILALRHVAWAAKQIATLQHLSGDRALVGVGTGGIVHGDAAWRAVGVPFAERGPRTETALAALPDLIAGRAAAVGGEKVTLAPGATVPPILMGGGPVALRRAARLGHGWYPAFLPPEELAAAVREITDRTGRTPHVTVQVGMALGAGLDVDAHLRALAGYGMSAEFARRGLLSGGRAEAADHLAALFEAGADRVVGLPFGGDNRRQAELLVEAARA